MHIGYARVSTQDQDNSAQIAALQAAGCTRIFQEKASAGRWDRPELHRLLDQLRHGDVLVVCKLDRLSRSLKDLLMLLEKVQLLGAGFHSLGEAIDTTTSAGRMMMQIVGSFAEFERAMLRERTRSGLLAACKEGRVGGRRPKLTPTPATRNHAAGRVRAENRSRCRTPVQCSPLNGRTALGQEQGDVAQSALTCFIVRFLRRPLQGRAQRVRHHKFHEPAWQLLGQCLQRDTVRLTEGRAPAQATLRNPAPGQG